MKTTTIRAVFENGVFRPLDKVDLPDKGHFEFEPRQIVVVKEPDDMSEIYEILSHRHHSGHTDTAERHNEHQP